MKILIDRMESNPEDFIRGTPPSFEYESPTPKFAHISGSLEDMLRGKEDRRDYFIHLTAEEKTALVVAYRNMMRQAFTASVIATTFDTEGKEERKRVLVTTKASGFAQAPVKREGGPVAYYSNDGLPATDTQLINHEIRKQIDRQIQPWK